MQATWARYFSRFLAAYKRHGISLWGVTVQNEPEAHVRWEACLWTPRYMATFVRDHLGPVLEADHPGVKILGFDHNKDHVHIWAKELYADSEAAQYFYGVGVHWYGGLNAKNLNYTHHLHPSKAILATEACNCGGVVFREPARARPTQRSRRRHVLGAYARRLCVRVCVLARSSRRRRLPSHHPPYRPAP